MHALRSRIIYPEGANPGGPSSTIWNYVNGIQTSTTGMTNGMIVFTGGLPVAGKWVAYFLEDDGYTKLASVSFVVGAIPGVIDIAVHLARLLGVANSLALNEPGELEP